MFPYHRTWQYVPAFGGTLLRSIHSVSSPATYGVPTQQLLSAIFCIQSAGGRRNDKVA